MKRLCLSQKDTRRGVASLYVVLFSTILFGVITLSFMRIVLSEAGQSSDDDLSQSAYDSAMAGVEDAKRAVNRYYACLSQANLNPTGTLGPDCNADARRRLFGDKDCTDGIGLAEYLYGSSYSTPDQGWEVTIQETNAAQADTAADQAYTCVVISDTVPDYRGTLTTDTRTRVIPLAVYDGNPASNTNAARVAKVSFQWYSLVNEGSNSLNLRSSAVFADQDTVPPTIQLSFIYLPVNISGVDFNSANNNSGYYYSTLELVPTQNGNNNSVTWAALESAGNVTSGQNKPLAVNCSSANEFACTVELNLGMGGRSNHDNIFLVASMPYGDMVMDFAARMTDNNGDPVNLVGSQISVDSTGRTADLVRRVETRLDPADLYFPYPQFALELNDGSGNEALEKSFWVTDNCWYSKKLGGVYMGGACDNNVEM